MHINLSVRNSTDAVHSGADTVHGETDTMRDGTNSLARIIAGLLELVPEMTLFFNPSENSYERLGGSRASSRIGWSRRSRALILRVPDTDGQRVELRSPDALCNPYLAHALVIYAALYGIEKNLPLPEEAPASLSPDRLARYRKLPATYQEAVAAAFDSTFIRQRLPFSVLTAYCRQRGVQK